jgi:hypothetical protein
MIIIRSFFTLTFSKIISIPFFWLFPIIPGEILGLLSAKYLNYLLCIGYCFSLIFTIMLKVGGIFYSVILLTSSPPEDFSLLFLLFLTFSILLDLFQIYLNLLFSKEIQKTNQGFF